MNLAVEQIKNDKWSDSQCSQSHRWRRGL